MGAPINYVGRTYNYLHVLEQKRENKKTYLYCRCTLCGTEKWIRADMVTSGKQVSCGCYNAEHNLLKPKDITGQKFGRLTAKYPTGKRAANGTIIWYCECECGGHNEVSAGDLIKLRILSCGCLAKEAHRKNGQILGQKTREICVAGTNVRSLTAKIPKNNTSGYKGVTWNKERHLWVAQIGFKGKNYTLGRYANITDAVKARQKAEEKIFGNFLKWYYTEYKKGASNNGQ